MSTADVIVVVAESNDDQGRSCLSERNIEYKYALVLRAEVEVYLTTVTITISDLLQSTLHKSI